MTVKMLCIQGLPWTVFSTSATAAAVRLVEAESGSCTSAMKAPWSSSGRNPEGTRLPMPPVASTKPPTRMSARKVRRAIGVTRRT